MSVDLQSIWEDSEEFDLQKIETLLVKEFRPQKYKHKTFCANTNSDIKFREYLKKRRQVRLQSRFRIFRRSKVRRLQNISRLVAPWL